MKMSVNQAKLSQSFSKAYSVANLRTGANESEKRSKKQGIISEIKRAFSSSSKACFSRRKYSSFEGKLMAALTEYTRLKYFSLEFEFVIPTIVVLNQKPQV